MKTLTIDRSGDDAIVDETLIGGAGGEATANIVIEEDAEGDPKKTKLPTRAVRNDNGSVTLPLVKAVGFTVKSSTGSRREEVKELTFHELTGADLRIMAQQSEDMKPVVAFARSTRIATNRMAVIFDQLGSRDVKAGGDIISFLSE